MGLGWAGGKTAMKGGVWGPAGEWGGGVLESFPTVLPIVASRPTLTEACESSYYDASLFCSGSRKPILILHSSTHF